MPSNTVPTPRPDDQGMPPTPWKPGPRHDGILNQAETADGFPETDPAWAGWWAECLCGWEMFFSTHDDAADALDEHVAGLSA